MDNVVIYALIVGCDIKLERN